MITARSIKLAASQLEMGQKVEMEHSQTIKDLIRDIKAGKKIDVKEVAKTIAKDHLKELKNYYTLLTKMEKSASLIRVATIVKREDGYHVISEKKDKKGHHKNLGGPYKSRAQAVKRLRSIEFWKHKGGA